MTTIPVEALRARLSRPEHLLTSEAERFLHGRDCWPRLQLVHRQGGDPALWPDAVFRPAAEEELTAFLRGARELGVGVNAWGGGSGVTGAAVHTQGGVAVDLKRLCDLDLSRAGDGLVLAGAGWNGARLEEALQRHGLTLGHFPSSILCSTVGGWAATRSAGQLSSRFGKIEDMVVALRVVDGRGGARWIGCSDRDELALQIGSEGCVSLITAVWLRVEPSPRWHGYRGYLAPDLDTALDALQSVLHAGHRPAVLRLYDPFDSYISSARKAGASTEASPLPAKSSADEEEGLLALLRSKASQVVGSRAAKSLSLRAANAMLSRMSGATSWLRRAVDTAMKECFLVVGVEEADEAVGRAVFDDVHAHFSARLRDLGEAPGEHWLAHRYRVSFKQAALLDGGLFVDTMEIAAPWERLSAIYHEVCRAVEPYAFVMAHFSHSYTTGGAIYFTFAGFGTSDADALRRYQAAWSAGLDAVVRSGGAATHHHGVGVLKASHLYVDHEGAAERYVSWKRGHDPEDLLNPGKLWTQGGGP